MMEVGGRSLHDCRRAILTPRSGKLIVLVCVSWRGGIVSLFPESARAGVVGVGSAINGVTSKDNDW
jgi:hypothetical protein